MWHQWLKESRLWGWQKWTETQSHPVQSPALQLRELRSGGTWLGQGPIADPMDGYCVVQRCCVVKGHHVVKGYCVVWGYRVIWRCWLYALFHSWSHDLTMIPTKYTCQVSRRNGQFPLLCSTKEETWRLCNISKVASKTDFDSIISFPHEETGSEREMTFPKYHDSINEWTMSRIQEKYSEKRSDRPV